MTWGVHRQRWKAIENYGLAVMLKSGIYLHLGRYVAFVEWNASPEWL